MITNTRIVQRIFVKKTVYGLWKIRYLNTGGSIVVKMSTKTLTVTHYWKQQIKKYLMRISSGDTKIDSVLNKEINNILQRLQSTNNQVLRYFEALSVNLTLPSTTMQPAEKTNNNTISLPNVFNDLKERLMKKDDEQVKKIVPNWRNLAISKVSVNSRTQQILYSLNIAESDHVKYRRMEELIEHLQKYPEAKHHFVKDGAIRSLLSIFNKTKNPELLSITNECLTRLGYVHPVSGQGVRILSIDGGGVRGILVIEMLKKLEELTGKRIHELFDIITGVSTGAILASMVCLKYKPLDEVNELYRDISTKIFTQSRIKGTSNLVWSHSYYDTALWERLLKDMIGEQSLISTSRDHRVPKLCALSAIVNQTRLSAYIFRNYALPCRVQSQYPGSHEHLIWEAVRASAAAPTYFEEFKLGNLLHQDGGILINNPTAVAIHEAKLLWPNTPIQCVVSFGTGRTVPPNPIDNNHNNSSLEYTSLNSSSWKRKFYALIDSATDTEAVHTMLSDLLPNNIYYRFNPYLTEMLDIDEINPKKIQQLQLDALMYLRRNEDKFQDAAKVLNCDKTSIQKLSDWLNIQKEIYGFTNGRF